MCMCVQQKHCVYDDVKIIHIIEIDDAFETVHTTMYICIVYIWIHVWMYNTRTVQFCIMYKNQLFGWWR